jgi:S-formylglutathione hydrolase FrmB
MYLLKRKLIITYITLFFVTLGYAQVDTLVVFSEAMQKEVKNVVILPEGYDSQSQGKPVLYLLHGATGDYKNWVARVPAIKKLSTLHDMIVVCPDGGYTSWYFDSPIDPQMQYETYVAKELVEAVDANYNTMANKENRAITGLSMGGHGAFYLAFKHQDVFGVAGSMSGGVDIRPYPNNWDIKKRLGTYPENKALWESSSVVNLVYLLDGDLKLIFDCGYDDFFFEDNRRLHQLLLERNIKHDYIERPGVHNWEYWANSIKYQMLFFNDAFTRID